MIFPSSRWKDVTVRVPFMERSLFIRSSTVATAALEQARLERELGEAEARLAAARARLTNDSFLAKAPPAVVDGARASATW